MPAEPLWRALLAPVIALLIFVLLVGTVRGPRRLGAALGRALARRMGPRAARALGGLAVAAMLLFLVGGIALDRFLAAMDDAFAVANARTAEGVEQPADAGMISDARWRVGLPWFAVAVVLIPISELLRSISTDSAERSIGALRTSV